MQLAVALGAAALALVWSATAVRAEVPTAAPLDAQVQDLKKDILALNRDLFILEEELLYPANTQTAVFVSMDVGEFFALDSVQLEVDGKEVANYLYTEREIDALIRGGVQKLWLGNLKSGEHELVAFFTGKGPHGRDYRRGTTLTFEKGTGTKYVELTIADEKRNLKPEFAVREWE
ncbi:MAG: AraC family transcriptional regulator [Pseudomonadota bacterium]